MKAPVIILLLVFHICLWIAEDAYSQQKKIDSLNGILKTSPPDTVFIDANIELSNIYLDDQPDKGAKYAHDALSMAEKLNNNNFIARALHTLGPIKDTNYLKRGKLSYNSL